MAALRYLKVSTKICPLAAGWLLLLEGDFLIAQSIVLISITEQAANSVLTARIYIYRLKGKETY